MNQIHTPERLAGESFEDYERRRKASRAANRLLVEGDLPLSLLGRSPQRINPKRQGRRAMFIRQHGVRQWKKLKSKARALLAAGAAL